MNTNKLNYISNYNKANYKMYQFRIRKDDTEVIQKLDGIPNRNGYLSNLIKKDLFSSVLTIKQIKQLIRPVMEKHRITDVYLFGSYARGEARSDSDVDIYCSEGDVETLYDEVDLIEELERALGKKVDVVTIGSKMSTYFKKHLEEDMIKLW